MFHLDILQDQYVVFLSAAAGVLLVGVVLAYFAIWRQRPDEQGVPEDRDHHVPFKLWLWYFPWIVIGVITFFVAWAVVYLIIAAAHPPNI